MGRGECEGVRLGPAIRDKSSKRSCELAVIAGNEGEKTDGGRAAGRSWEDGIR